MLLGWPTLESTVEWHWRTGFASLIITGQDLGVLVELDRAITARSPYKDELASQTFAVGHGLAPLFHFLGDYLSGRFEIERLPHPTG